MPLKSFFIPTFFAVLLFKEALQPRRELRLSIGGATHKKEEESDAGIRSEKNWNRCERSTTEGLRTTPATTTAAAAATATAAATTTTTTTAATTATTTATTTLSNISWRFSADFNYVIKTQVLR